MQYANIQLKHFHPLHFLQLRMSDVPFINKPNFSGKGYILTYLETILSCWMPWKKRINLSKRGYKSKYFKLGRTTQNKN